MTIKYRKAEPNDIEEICSIVHDAVVVMERDNIFQWDDLYPAKEDFQEDIKKSQLFKIKELLNLHDYILKSN